jgi:hypothetical protein
MLTITRTLPNGDRVETTILDGQSLDVIQKLATAPGLGAKIIVMKPRPLTEAELLLEGQHVVECHL